MLELTEETSERADDRLAGADRGDGGAHDRRGRRRAVGRRRAHRDARRPRGVLERRRRFRLGEELREIVARRLELRAREICTGDRWDALTERRPRPRARPVVGRRRDARLGLRSHAGVLALPGRILAATSIERFVRKSKAPSRPMIAN